MLKCDFNKAALKQPFGNGCSPVSAVYFQNTFGGLLLNSIKFNTDLKNIFD